MLYGGISKWRCLQENLLGIAISSIIPFDKGYSTTFP